MLRLIPFFAFITIVLTVNSSYFLQANDYHFSTVQASYFQAYAICKKNGLTLAAPRTSLDENNLNDALAENGITYSFWIGGFYLRDQQFLPDFVWLDYGEPLNYTRWASYEPAIVTTGEYCLAQYGVGSGFPYPGRWFANLCNSTFFFACQRR